MNAKRSEWLDALAVECARTSQAATARRLGVSGAMINQVLKGSYRGRLDRIENRVRGELMHGRVVCPVLGAISTRQCEDEQAQPYSTVSRLRVAVYHACRGGCPHFGREAKPKKEGQ